jgi:hypothetical protein
MPPTGQPADQPPVATIPSDIADTGGRGSALAQGSLAMSPAFFGDMVGYSATRFLPTNKLGGVFVPILARSAGFKIAEYESPRPTDRIYYAFNFYSNVNQSLNPAGIDLFRNTVGFEKTFLDGDASFGMRFPFVNTSGLTGIEENRFSDMSIIVKYAMYNDRTTGDVFSGGLVITVPTGGGITVDYPGVTSGIVDGTNTVTFYDVLLQPFVGWVRNVGEKFYLHGFHSIVVPTDARDVTVMFNDLAVGCWAYRNYADTFVQGIVPTVEFHLNTPLTHRGSRTQPIGLADQFDITIGSYVMFPRSLLGIAVGLPVTGPKPFEVEAAANFTLRF